MCSNIGAFGPIGGDKSQQDIMTMEILIPACRNPFEIISSRILSCLVLVDNTSSQIA